MSGFGFTRQGVSIIPREITFDDQAPHFRLKKVSEIRFVGEPQVVQQMPTWLRQYGVQIGIRLDQGHQLENNTLRFGVGTRDQTPPPPRAIALVADGDVTTTLGGLFAAPGQWVGFELLPQQIPPMKAASPEDEAFFTEFTIRNFHPGQKLDFQMVPVVFVLRGVGLQHHYILGCSVFTSGWKKQGDIDDFWTTVEAVPKARVMLHERIPEPPPTSEPPQAP